MGALLEISSYQQFVLGLMFSVSSINLHITQKFKKNFSLYWLTEKHTVHVTFPMVKISRFRLV